ncbi:hypothetical protein [Elongatibacter sediminis]|uniref:Lipocalin-like domain-containing protein n=1 Tax=Elongatibacter sediminis TaxID=3119006 RepID=A0AAW9R665_9GAMM
MNLNSVNAISRRFGFRSTARLVLLGLALGLGSGSAVAGDATAAETEKQVTGLWLYTGLTTSGGNEMPLTGVFLFKDDTFIQHAVFNGEPLEAQGSMAHAGPYQAHAGYVHLVAEQTISTSGGENPSLSFQANTEHDVTVDRDGESLSLVFSMGTGTVQDFEWVGPGEGELYQLEDGAFALVDGHFVLVEGDADAIVSGYGTYDRDGENLSLNVILWTDASSEGATNVADVTIEATFDGTTLTLADGRSFKVES